jgi:hypothetical protein
MKNKTLIILLLAVIICSCCKSESNKQVVKEENLQNYKIIIIDSCEYIEKYNGYHIGYNFSHKGNCKFCKERSKK